MQTTHLTAKQPALAALVKGTVAAMALRASAHYANSRAVRKRRGGLLESAKRTAEGDAALSLDVTNPLLGRSASAKHMAAANAAKCMGAPKA